MYILYVYIYNILIDQVLSDDCRFKIGCVDLWVYVYYYINICIYNCVWVYCNYL